MFSHTSALKHNAPIGSLVAGTIKAEDPTLYGETMRPWDLTLSPIERGRFDHWLTFLKTKNLCFYKEYYSLASVIQGASPPGVLAVTLPLFYGRRSLYWKKSMTGSGMPGTITGPIDVTVDTDQLHLVLLVKLAFLERELSERLLSNLICAANNHFLPMPEAEFARLSGWMCHNLDAAQRNPKRFEEPTVSDTVERDLLGHLSLIANRLCPANHGCRRPKASRHGIQRAMEHLRDVDVCGLSVANLCRLSGVTERTLEYAFRDMFGLTPQGFIRRKRFHAVRAKLLTADPYETTVTAIAMEHGIHNLGRFAAEYRDMFGESPSQTLQNFTHKPTESLAMLPPEKD